MLHKIKNSAHTLVVVSLENMLQGAETRLLYGAGSQPAVALQL